MLSGIKGVTEDVFFLKKKLLILYYSLVMNSRIGSNDIFCFSFSQDWNNGDLGGLLGFKGLKSIDFEERVLEPGFNEAQYNWWLHPHPSLLCLNICYSHYSITITSEKKRLGLFFGILKTLYYLYVRQPDPIGLTAHAAVLLLAPCLVESVIRQSDAGIKNIGPALRPVAVALALRRHPTGEPSSSITINQWWRFSEWGEKAWEGGQGQHFVGESGPKEELGPRVGRGSSRVCHKILPPFLSCRALQWCPQFCDSLIVSAALNKPIRATVGQQGIRKLMFLYPEETFLCFILC